MFAKSPFASSPFGSLGSRGPAYISATMSVSGKGSMSAFAFWFQQATSSMDGVGLYEPKMQMLRVSSIRDNGVGDFTVKACSYFNFILDAKGYSLAVFTIDYTVDTEMFANGVGNVDFAPGYKMYSEALMNGAGFFNIAASGTFQTRLVAKGLGTFQGMTAYKHTSQTSFRGVGLFNIAASRSINFSFTANGKGYFNIVAVAPGDDEADFYSKGIGVFIPRGQYTAASSFKCYGSCATRFYGSALYQSTLEADGVGTFNPYFNTKFSFFLRVFGHATAVFNTQFAKTFSSEMSAMGKGYFIPKFNYYGNSRFLMYGASSAIFNTIFAKVENTSSKMLGIGLFKPSFTANAITSSTMIGLGTFRVNTFRAINSYSLFKGYGYVDFKPGNPLYSSLPSAEDVFIIPLDPNQPLIWSDDMYVGNVSKQPIERKDYDIDFKKWLLQRDPEDTLNGLDYAVTRISGCGPETSMLEVDLVQITASTAKIWVRNGSHKSTYKVEVTVNTVRGRVDQSELIIYVEDK